MRGLRRFSLLLLVLLIAGVVTLFLLRSVRGQQAGPPAAICPGPDAYGYVCAGDVVFEYVDAGNDTMLYGDDALTLLALPFTFTFYGTGYDAVWASSNGNLQFGSEDASFDNVCLVPKPAVGMGDMIAPFWDDLDLTQDGFLKSEVVGQPPERVFVVEWQDVPRFGWPEDRLTFEVQLFEGSNDIVFLYRDARTLEGANGSRATIGLQSERLGYALQVGCDQYAVSDGNVIHFIHPEDAAADQMVVGNQSAEDPDLSEPATAAVAPAKGPARELVAALNERGLDALSVLELTWLSRRPPLSSDWRRADLDGDGEQELVVIWRSDVSRPELVELAVLGQADEGRWQSRWQARPLARQERLGALALAAQGDLTGDGAQEIILRDPLTGGLVVLMKSSEDHVLVDLPSGCSGSFVLQDTDADGAQEIIRGGCPGGQRRSVWWTGRGFVTTAAR